MVDKSGIVLGITPVLPAADVVASLGWWNRVCGFTEVFSHGNPPAYAGVANGAANLHLALMDDTALAKMVGEQTMVRIAVANIDDFHAEFLRRGGVVHPNGVLQTKPWGSRELATIDPNGVCVTFYQ